LSQIQKKNGSYIISEQKLLISEVIEKNLWRRAGRREFSQKSLYKL